jgi:hypothetical protein
MFHDNVFEHDAGNGIHRMFSALLVDDVHHAGHHGVALGSLIVESVEFQR